MQDHISTNEHYTYERHQRQPKSQWLRDTRRYLTVDIDVAALKAKDDVADTKYRPNGEPYPDQPVYY